MELTAVFQYLLAHLNYVSLPGLGSFMKLYNSAQLSSDGKTITPPHESFVFSTERNFNDEVLEEYLHESTGISLTEASEQITNFVNDITIRITKGEAINFEGIGKLQLQSNGNIGLVVDEQDLASQTYGLQSISVNPRTIPTSTTPTTNKQNKKVQPKVSVSNSDSSKIAFYVAICFAVTVVIVIFTSPSAQFWKHNPKHVDNVAQQLPIKPIDNISELVTTQVDSVVASEVIEQQSQQKSVSDQPIEISTDKKTALLYTESAIDNRMHYIIVGSFSQKTNATKLIEDLEKKGYKPTILQDNSTFRVALYKFSNRDRALRELERLKDQNISKTVWLYSL